MRNFLKITALFLLVVSAQAQEKNKAKALLDQVVAKTKSYKNIVIDFKYSIYNAKEKINQEREEKEKEIENRESEISKLKDGSAKLSSKIGVLTERTTNIESEILKITKLLNMMTPYPKNLSISDKVERLICDRDILYAELQRAKKEISLLRSNK
jgi:chromosome segregation ATPase